MENEGNGKGRRKTEAENGNIRFRFQFPSSVSFFRFLLFHAPCHFSGCDMRVKTKLIVTHCLSLYGCVLWRIDSKKIRALETAFNNILRKIWRLPRQCHTRILHCVAGVQSLFNRIPDLFSNFISRALASKSTFIRSFSRGRLAMHSQQSGLTT